MTIRIGALGEFEFPEGDYIYTGSAVKNLRQRVDRHLSKDKKMRWHIDYLLAAPEAEITSTEIIESVERIECSLNLELLNSGRVTVPVRGFGSSDCRQCPAHLVAIKKH